MIGISCILHCYGNIVAITIRLKPLVLHCVEFIFGMDIPWDDIHQTHSLLLWLLGFYGKKIPQ